MKKLLQGTFGIVKIGLGILLLLSVLLWLLVDLNPFKSSLVGLIHAKTGWSVTIPKRLQLTFFPNLGLQLEQLSVKNTESFSEQLFAEFGNVDLSIKWLPLFSGQIELDTLYLDGLSLYLSRNKQGQANWEDVLRSNDDTDTKPLTQKIMGILGAFEGEGIQLEHGYLRYEDQLTGRILELKEVNVHIARLQLGQTIPVTLAFILHQNSPELTQSVQIHFDVEFNVSKNMAQIKPFQLSSDTPSRPQLKTRLTIANLEYQLDKHFLVISGVHLVNAPLNVYSELQGQVQQENFALQGSIKLPEFNLKQWLSEWSIALPELQDKATLTRFSAESKLTITQDSVQLAPIAMMIDQTALKGSLRLNHFNDPHLNFNILADKVVLENYLTPKSNQVPTDSVLTPESLSKQIGALSQPLAFLKNFQSDGQLKIQQMSLNDVSIQDFVVELHE